MKKSIELELTSADDIQDWMVQYLSDHMQVPTHSIDIKAPFDSFAIDSATAIGMTGELEDCLGREVDPTLVYDYPTIEAFSGYLATSD